MASSRIAAMICCKCASLPLYKKSSQALTPTLRVACYCLCWPRINLHFLRQCLSATLFPSLVAISNVCVLCCEVQNSWGRRHDQHGDQSGSPKDEPQGVWGAAEPRGHGDPFPSRIAPYVEYDTAICSLTPTKGKESACSNHLLPVSFCCPDVLTYSQCPTFKECFKSSSLKGSTQRATLSGHGLGYVSTFQDDFEFAHSTKS